MLLGIVACCLWRRRKPRFDDDDDKSETEKGLRPIFARKMECTHIDITTCASTTSISESHACKYA